MDANQTCTVKTKDVRELISLVRDLRDHVAELEGASPSKDMREQYIDQLCARIETQID